MKNRYINPFKKYTHRMQLFLISLMSAITFKYAPLRNLN